MLFRYIINTMIFMVFLAILPAHAQHIPTNLHGIRADFSGNWFNPDQSGHGLQLEVLDDGRAVIAWYTFDRDGNPLWLFGTGYLQDLQIDAELTELTGGRPPALWNEADLSAIPWGQIELELDTCNTAILRWDSVHPDFGSGELLLKRLTRLQGMRCNSDEFFSRQFRYSFERGTEGFSAVFADLPANYDQATYQLDFRREPVPPPLQGFTGIRLSGQNSSDDLAMLIKTPVQGLLPDKLYRVELDAELITDTPHSCSGVGGAPGESVYVKLGAASTEPLAVIDPTDQWLRLNIDFGNQSTGGADARVAGNLANRQSCENGLPADWELKKVTTEGQTIIRQSDSNGTLWVFAGTDSAFEGFTRYYIVSLTVRLEAYN